MSVLAFVLASFVALSPQSSPPPAPQDPGANGKPALLTPAEQASLRSKLMKFLDASDAYDRATTRPSRDKTGRAREKAKEDFEKDWSKAEKKGNVLGSMADLRAIFVNCFQLAAPSFSTGQLREETLKEDGTKFSFFLPKTYAPDKPHRTVVVLPGTTTPDGGASFAKPSDYFTAVWDKTNLIMSTIVHVCHVPERLELDPVPDLSREADEADEDKRNRAVWSGFGQMMQTYNVDRGAVFLDCGRGSCGFGLRFLSMFPDRFAGIVLRQPIEVDDIRVGSLHGKAVLLIKSAATAKAVDALKKRLEEIGPGMVTVIDAADEYPYRGSAQAIEDWMGKQRRNMAPAKVVVEPNHDRFNRAYWVDIDRADPLLGAPLDSRARIEVVADRATNRIVVKTRGVESFILMLNDDLVDLDKEFTVEINGKATPEKKVRSFRDMRDRMVGRRDWEYLFPVMYTAQVPKAADDKPKTGDDKKPAEEKK